MIRPPVTKDLPWSFEDDAFLAHYSSAVGAGFVADHDLNRNEEDGPSRYRYLRKIGWWKRLRSSTDDSLRLDYNAHVEPVTPAIFRKGGV